MAIASVPAGASVNIDGSKAGITPLSVPLPGGKRISVTLEKAGYKPETRQIDCTSTNVAIALVQDKKVAVSHVTLVYGGMFPGSEKNVEITIGGVTFRPSGNGYVATGVPLGAVEYSVGGTMVVPSGPCNVTGNGNLTLKDGDILEEILWDRRTRVPSQFFSGIGVDRFEDALLARPAPAKITITDERGHSRRRRSSASRSAFEAEGVHCRGQHWSRSWKRARSWRT